MKYNVNLGFKEGDLVYHIKNNIIQTNQLFKVHAFEIKEGGNFHDGYEETHYAYMEDMETHLVEKREFAFINLMCQKKYIYFVKCTQKEEQHQKEKEEIQEQH